MSVSCPSPPGSGALSFAYNRGGAAPVRRSTSHGFGADLKSWDDIIHIKMIDRVCAHQQPINGLKTEGGRVVTASQDHTLKVRGVGGGGVGVGVGDGGYRMIFLLNKYFCYVQRRNPSFQNNLYFMANRMLNNNASAIRKYCS